MEDVFASPVGKDGTALVRVPLISGVPGVLKLVTASVMPPAILLRANAFAQQVSRTSL